MLIKKTYSPKLAEIERRWFVVDAAGIPVGRLATLVATRLRGKHKPSFAPHIDTGDFVIVINAEKAVLTGRKEEQKIYHYHTGYPGGIKSESAAKMRQRKPIKIIEQAVWGMLPKGPLGRRQIRKLKVYAGTEHPHEAQRPEALAVETRETRRETSQTS